MVLIGEEKSTSCILVCTIRNLCDLIPFRATLPDVPRHRHHQGDPTPDRLSQHQ